MNETITIKIDEKVLTALVHVETEEYNYGADADGNRYSKREEIIDYTIDEISDEQGNNVTTEYVNNPKFIAKIEKELYL